MKVKKTKIRGEQSVGMLCSERELGLSDDHSGIMILPPDVPIGAPFAEALQLADTVLELSVTPNRSDCLSMIGVAREVAALTKDRARPPEFTVPESGPDTTTLTSVTIDDDLGCPRYAARIVAAVTIGPSPLWMQERLKKAGLRPLNNVVDVTNYVLIELGHPLHAFDYEKLEENRIVVRRARGGESFVTLDGAERALSKDMLVIADAQQPVAIAGVMGGANSEVTEQTRTVLIESAYFDPMTIRRTSKALGLSTEASYRFERGADPDMVITAINRAASLMAELAGGTIAKGAIDEYPRKIASPEIRLRHARTAHMLGIDVPAEDTVAILKSLGFEVLVEESDAVQVRVPSYRPDVTAEIDLIEEVARIYGYDNIVPTYPQDTTVMSRGQKPRRPEDTCRGTLRSCGFSEAITFSIGAPGDMADFGNAGDNSPGGPIHLMNPLAEDASVLRTSLVPGLLRNIRMNCNAGAKDMKVFEIGKVYWPVEGELLPNERTFVCAAATGLLQPINWRGTPAEIDFFTMKGVAETVLASLGAASAEAKRASCAGFHPGVCADLVIGGTTVGTVGEIHPGLLDKYDFGQKVFVLELDIDTLESAAEEERTYEKFSRFPHADRDLAVVIDEAVETGALTSAIAEAGGEILRRVLLFDVYRGNQVGEGKKSLAFNLRFLSSERTLTDEEVGAACDRILKVLTDRFGARLRA
jgi:phenylalanyl-tRNA synthetase beta chain